MKTRLASGNYEELSRYVDDDDDDGEGGRSLVLDRRSGSTKHANFPSNVVIWYIRRLSVAGFEQMDDLCWIYSGMLMI